MAIHDNSIDQAIESISECLGAAKLLIDRQPKRMGYAALLLLFCSGRMRTLSSGKPYFIASSATA